VTIDTTAEYQVGWLFHSSLFATFLSLWKYLWLTSFLGQTKFLKHAAHETIPYLTAHFMDFLFLLFFSEETTACLGVIWKHFHRVHFSQRSWFFASLYCESPIFVRYHPCLKILFQELSNFFLVIFFRHCWIIGH